MGRSKTRDKVVFGSAHGTFGSESTMLAGGGESDSDIRQAEKVNEGLGGLKGRGGGGRLRVHEVSLILLEPVR